jgi:hypothetical protein
MRTFSDDFRNALRGIKEVIGVVTYRTTGGRLLTQTNEYVLTQDNDKIKLEQSEGATKLLASEIGKILKTELNKYIATEQEEEIIESGKINSISISFDAKLLHTICSSLQIVTSEKIDDNTKINVKIGVLVGDTYEYIDMGYFYNFEPAEYDLASGKYIIIAYDRMYKSMVKYEQPLDIFPCTHKELLEEILNICEIEHDNLDYGNKNNTIPKDYWIEDGVTYRDILDELCVSGGFGAIIKNNKFTPKIYYDTEEIINAEDLQEQNVYVGEKYGPINYVEAESFEGVTYLIGKDNSSITNNGLTKYNLGINRILVNDEEGTYYENVFNAIKGLEFYIYDLASTGILIFEPLDMFTINRFGLYKTILLHDSINVTTGLREDLFLEKPEENVDEYSYYKINNEKVKNAIINVDKSAGQIVLKATSDDKIVKVALNADAEQGSEFSVKAEQINFDAYEFNLSTTNLKILSDNIDITNEGINLKNGAVIANQNGLLSMFQYTAYQSDLGWYSEDGGETASKHYLAIHYDIPEGFRVVSAYVVLTHIPTDNTTWDIQTGQQVVWRGYARNVCLYSTDMQGLVYPRGMLMSEPRYQELYMQKLEWQNGTWQHSGYTGSSSTATMVKTGDIKENLKPYGLLLVGTSDNSVTGWENVNKQTGVGTATLYVIGYYPYTS